MERGLLEVSQLLGKHPVMKLSARKKRGYMSILAYVTHKFSEDEIWAQAELRLYGKILCGTWKEDTEGTLTGLTSLAEFVQESCASVKFFSQRFCLLIDCIFINALSDRKKGEQILREVTALYGFRYHGKLQRVFRWLYGDDVFVGDIKGLSQLCRCWTRNREFQAIPALKIMVTATMSAGKSTLLNALVGRHLNKTQNDSCTAKVHTLVNKAFEDGFCYEYDYLLELDADLQTLMDDNEQNENKEIVVGAYFRSLGKPIRPVWLLDTPGVNSSQDLAHGQLSERAIATGRKDLMLFVLNGENIGTEDERKHLGFLLDHYEGDVLFVVNKVDRFRKGDDSVADTLETTRRALKDIGFKDPTVVPVSAYGAYLAKMTLFGESLDEDDRDEFERLCRKLNKPEYQFDRYYPQGTEVTLKVREKAEMLLLHSGLLNLENMIYKVK